jgi:phage terminase large subunit-like protein
MTHRDPPFWIEFRHLLAEVKGPPPGFDFDRVALLDPLPGETPPQAARARLAAYAPYPRQAEFHAAGAAHRERLFLAGNQLGKTLAGAAETAMHLTGRYPKAWRGRRFTRPVTAWAGGPTAETTRDNVQRLLLGRAGERGTGLLPADALTATAPARGIADACDFARVRHASGGTSFLKFKSYDQGRARWQGETVDLVWFDEEPPQEIYSEGLTRTNATGGIVFLTCTPLLGMTRVIARFLEEDSADRHTTQMTIDDAPHYTPEERARIVASYAPHEREARTMGIPSLGSGRVFPIEEQALREPAFAIPPHWPRIAGLDFGWDHPTAAVWLAWDRDADIVHVTDAYRVREETPLVHAAALNARGKWIPVAWPADGLQHDKGSGAPLAEQYRGHGVSMLHQHAQFPDGSTGFEAGLAEMLDRMKTGRLKVAAHLTEWWQEFRLYHRKDGRVVKEQDDLLSATRYALMMLRFARTEPKPGKGFGRRIVYPDLGVA